MVAPVRRRPSLGRQKIEIRRMESEEARQVCFSKRRAGFFKKARELSILCGADVAAAVFSPAGKAYSFSHPSVECLLERFLDSSSPPTQQQGNAPDLLTACINPDSTKTPSVSGIFGEGSGQGLKAKKMKHSDEQEVAEMNVIPKRKKIKHPEVLKETITSTVALDEKEKNRFRVIVGPMDMSTLDNDTGSKAFKDAVMTQMVVPSIPQECTLVYLPVKKGSDWSVYCINKVCQRIDYLIYSSNEEPMDAASLCEPFLEEVPFEQEISSNDTSLLAMNFMEKYNGKLFNLGDKDTKTWSENYRKSVLARLFDQRANAPGGVAKKQPGSQLTAPFNPTFIHAQDHKTVPKFRNRCP
uniref:MADS-box domain-containing protein n=1 Tax=Oryza brachyantha TaxID=4533 RepID=J3L8G0_ORYBR